MPPQAVTLEAHGLVKSYLDTPVVDDVDLVVEAGEIVGLVGKNGAGKSTVIKMLSGVVRPDAGTIRIMGSAAAGYYTAAAANGLGLATMHQELEAVPDMTIGENVLLGSSYPRRAKVLVDWRRVRGEVDRLLGSLDVPASSSDAIRTLPNAYQRMVMIARALYHDARVLILDEPTASLSDEEIRRLFRVVRDLRAEGRSVIYVSHRLDEIFELTDRVLVMRDGRMVHEALTSSLSKNALIAAITGEAGAVGGSYAERRGTPGVSGEPVLTVRGLVAPTLTWPVSFDVRAGEILGLGGLVGSGRTELARMIVGADPVGGGEVAVDGVRVAAGSVRRAMSAGVALLPEDRRNEGLLMDTSVRENITLASLSRHRRFGLLSKRSERRATRERIDQLRIKTSSEDQPIAFLSGGNQQKVVLAKWLERAPKVMILDEPTQGIDIQAKGEVFDLIHEAAGAGKAIVLISSDFSELTAHCDRVLVLRENRLVGELSGSGLTDSAILALSYDQEQRDPDPRAPLPNHSTER